MKTDSKHSSVERRTDTEGEGKKRGGIDGVQLNQCGVFDAVSEKSIFI